MPPPDDRYWELEAVRVYGYRLEEWDALEIRVQAELIAHEIHRSLREAWQMEQVMDGDKSQKLSPVEQMRARFGFKRPAQT